MAQLVLTVNPTATPVSWGSILLSNYLAMIDSSVIVETKFVHNAPPIALSSAGTDIATDPFDILEKLSDSAGLSSNSSKSATFIALAKTLSGKLGFTEVTTALDTLDDHLAYRTYLVGYTVTAADWAVWGALKGSLQVIGILKRNAHVHLQRWYSHLESLPSSQAAYASFNEAKSQKKTDNTTSSAFDLGLPNAVEGKVVTRFPPEPSGYLHIGHAKAALLNQYFAKMYKGKMIIRFDDTNPSKEKSEFENTILEDLALMGIKGDVLTHTSDHFQKLYDSCVKMLETGKAYVDDTLQDKMREERMDGIESSRRNSSVQDNLARFAEMKKGTDEGQRWCVRAKISVDDPNKAMRDPVIYRCNMLPHHRTGSTWKAYPTYDFACPLVDALEGVTHALRTNEYRDRNPQYQWMLDALGLRKVEVWDFSRVNFIYTLLSKRKLHWFVNENLVTGWDDPRFPTVRGIRRRGLSIEALRTFMLAQGPSQGQMLLEWDGIWSANKKIIDPVAPRYWAINSERRVLVKLNGGPKALEIKEVAKHKKNPDLGMKKTVFSSTIFVEQEDAITFEDQEEITLMDWGNAIIRKKAIGPSGEVISIEADLFLEGDFKKTKKKITWLPEATPSNLLTSVTLIDFDYLITKKKLEEKDDVATFVTPRTEFRVDALADANVAQLKQGDVIQFERKGYYILDRVQGSPSSSDILMEFISVPDGRADSVASKAVASGLVTDPALTKKTLGPSSGGGWGKNAASKAASKNPNDHVMLSEGTKGFNIPVTTSMYSVDRAVWDTEAPADTKMYQVDSVYESPG